MEIRVLRYFLAVAKEESISKAAILLHISQPTLSRQLMDMEKELGKNLFIRGNRKITLTEEGLFLQKRAQEIVDLVDKTQSEFNTSDEIISGDIYIGGGETDAMRLISKCAYNLQKKYPNLRYHLFSGNGDDVRDKLDKGLIDFGIVIEPSDISKYDFIRIPLKDTWGLLMKKNSPYASKDFIEPSDIMKIPIITSSQTLVEKEISKWLGVNISELNIVATYNLVFNASLLVDEGMGYALCLDKLINTTGSSNLCFKPLYPPLEANLNIIWKKYQVFSRASEIFLNYIKKEFTNK
ncbi:LysR family transcriptional regulator [Bacillus sp. BAU-SS-2023]|nr:LysR family transcriptional regulator [Bacillus sp. BAU-SS-2023]